MRFLAAFAAAGALALAGCATPIPREPTSVGHGLLIARARVRGAVLGFTSDMADRVSVEQLDADGQPVPGKFAVSGASGDGDAIVLDLPPGRYALTAVSFPARGVRYEVTVSSALARPQSVELRPGAAAFLGELAMDGVFPDFDVAVERALVVVAHWATPFLKRPVVTRDADWKVLEKGPLSEARALRAAKTVLSGTQWELPIENRLRELGAPEPVATAGTIRSKELPLTRTPWFGWRDTLGWGEPAKGPTGLAWKEPGGDARVAVFFTSADAPGFAGYDEAVRQMRAESKALEDSAALFEVRVATTVGQAARATSYRYPESTLVGSEVRVTVTETVLVRDAGGMYTARLRAPRAEFDKAEPRFREFLLQLVLGPPPVEVKKPEPTLPL